MQACVPPATCRGQVDLKYPWERPWEISIALQGRSYSAIWFPWS